MSDTIIDFRMEAENEELSRVWEEEAERKAEAARRAREFEQSHRVKVYIDEPGQFLHAEELPAEPVVGDWITWLDPKDGDEPRTRQVVSRHFDRGRLILRVTDHE